MSSGAASWEEGGKLPPPYGWTSKNYVICVCFHCHGTSSYHTTNTLQGRRAKSHVDHMQYNRDLGTSYSRPPIDPYLTSPPLQNPGGATAYVCPSVCLSGRQLSNKMTFNLATCSCINKKTQVYGECCKSIISTKLGMFIMLFPKPHIHRFISFAGFTPMSIRHTERPRYLIRL